MCDRAYVPYCLIRSVSKANPHHPKLQVVSVVLVIFSAHAIQREVNQLNIHNRDYGDKPTYVIK